MPKHDPIENPDTRLKSTRVRRKSILESLEEMVRKEMPVLSEDAVHGLAYQMMQWHTAVKNGVLNRAMAYGRKTGDWDKAISREYWYDDMMPGAKQMKGPSE